MEQWWPVREFPDDYAISSLGRLMRVSPKRGATPGRIRKVRYLNGYPAYWLKHNRKVIVRTAHRLIADAFLGPIPPGMQVNHKDGNRANSVLDNLEIVTNSENRIHAYRVLGVPPNRGKLGIEHHNAALTWEQVCEVRKLHAIGVPVREISKRFGVSRTGIYRYINHKVRKSA